MDILQIAMSLVFLAVALFSLVKGSSFFVDGAKQIGASLGMSTFVIGVLIVGIGTSLPELASSIAAVMQNNSEIVLANVVGSNITNILLVIGVLAAVGGKISIKKNLLKTELPIFFIACTHFVAVVYDGTVDRIEALLLLGTFAAYIWYIFAEAEDEHGVEIIDEKKQPPRLQAKSLLYVLVGAAAVLIGAHYTVEIVVDIATALTVPVGLVSIGAIAIGTSLPELFVSIQAIKTGETELAVGNIFGSNVFNILMVTGIPAMIAPLTADVVVMQLGLGVFVAASAIFFVNGLAQQIMRWEGVMMLLFFAFFLVKMFSFV